MRRPLQQAGWQAFCLPLLHAPGLGINMGPRTPSSWRIPIEPDLRSAGSGSRGQRPVTVVACAAALSRRASAVAAELDRRGGSRASGCRRRGMPPPLREDPPQPRSFPSQSFARSSCLEPTPPTPGPPRGRSTRSSRPSQDTVHRDAQAEESRGGCQVAQAPEGALPVGGHGLRQCPKSNKKDIADLGGAARRQPQRVHRRMVDRIRPRCRPCPGRRFRGARVRTGVSGGLRLAVCLPPTPAADKHVAGVCCECKGDEEGGCKSPLPRFSPDVAAERLHAATARDHVPRREARPAPGWVGAPSTTAELQPAHGGEAGGLLARAWTAQPRPARPGDAVEGVWVLPAVVRVRAQRDCVIGFGTGGEEKGEAEEEEPQARQAEEGG